MPKKVMKTLNESSEEFLKFQPKLLHRFVVTIKDIPSWLVYNIERPVIFSNKDCGNAVEYSMCLYDPIKPSGEKIAYNWITKGDKRDIVIDILAPHGEIVSTWIYKQAHAESVQFSLLNWEKFDDDEQEKYITLYHIDTPRKIPAMSQLSRIRINFTCKDIILKDLMEN